MKQTSFHKELPRLPLVYSGVRQTDSDLGPLLPNGCLSPSVITKFIQVHLNVNFNKGDYQKSKFVHLAFQLYFFPQCMSLIIFKGLL